VSYIAMGILAILILYSVIILFLAVGKIVTWLNFLLLFSYVKLAVALIKYCPQVCVIHVVCLCVYMCLCVCDALHNLAYTGMGEECLGL